MPFDSFYEFTMILTVSVLSFLIFTSCFDARCVRGRGNDFYSAGALVNGSLQFLDLISDIFFSLKMWRSTPSLPLLLCAASTASIVVPSALSLGQLFYAVQRWRSMGKDTLTAYLRNYAFWLYATSLAMGSAFSGTQICRSDIFGLPQFAMPLNENQIVGFQSKKLWTTVMLEVECTLCILQ